MYFLSAICEQIYKKVASHPFRVSKINKWLACGRISSEDKVRILGRLFSTQWCYLIGPCAGFDTFHCSTGLVGLPGGLYICYIITWKEAEHRCYSTPYKEAQWGSNWLMLAKPTLVLPGNHHFLPLFPLACHSTLNPGPFMKVYEVPIATILTSWT